jgi:hypothetical protein
MCHFFPHLYMLNTTFPPTSTASSSVWCSPHLGCCLKIPLPTFRSLSYGNISITSGVEEMPLLNIRLPEIQVLNVVCCLICLLQLSMNLLNSDCCWCKVKNHQSVILPSVSFLNILYLGEAVSQNPGYLKLRKIRAAQSISRTVSWDECVLVILHSWHESITQTLHLVPGLTSEIVTSVSLKHSLHSVRPFRSLYELR